MSRSLLPMLLSALLLLPALILPAGAGDALLPDDGVPRVVRVGAGSYASRPPRDQNKRPWLPGKAGWGDDSQVFSQMRLYVSPGHAGPVPSTDWWTSLVSRQWSGQLWAYPGMYKATPAGVEVEHPHTWQIAPDAKTAKMISLSKLLVGAQDFLPLHAEAADWSDWLVKLRLPDAQGRTLLCTIGHGLPFAYFEFERLAPQITIGDGTLFGSGASGPADRVGLELAGDRYGIYAPAGTRFQRAGNQLLPQFSGKAAYLSIAPLTGKEDLDRFAPYAPVVPRETTVSWKYEPAQGCVETFWTIRAEDLSGQGKTAVLQGWLPHHYQPPAAADFKPAAPVYATPHGELRCAAGDKFAIRFPFTGLLPEYPAPAALPGADAYHPELMKKLIADQLQRTGYGSETYWGGKLVLLHARYMELARLMGLKEQTAIFRDRAAEAVRDWLSFTPGEGEHFFAWYPNWGSFVGCRSRDNANPGVDILQDHHMCYGYHVYAAALLALQDPAFARDWGPMAGLMARDYAEWDPQSKLFCRFRNLDPWCGHSWSGGMGEEDGNGQESSSEAMQGYGAMFLLGEALGDRAMRDAAAFCWATEARGISEYYFDRGARNYPVGWPHKMISNLHTNGLGYWTWFSGNPFWMHAIQWIPMSPLLDYLFEDPAYAARDYADMWKTHEGGQGWDGYLGNDSGPCNLTLNYLAGFDADGAAKVFQQLTDRNAAGVNGTEAGPDYWRIQSLRQTGPHRFDAWTDVPTSQAFGKNGGPVSWVVYNATDKPRDVKCFQHGKLVAAFTAPPRALSVMREGKVTSDAGRMEPIPPLRAASENEMPLSSGCAASASSQQGGDTGPDKAFDGDPQTRWSSKSTDSEWISVDLGRNCQLQKAVLQWEAAYGRDYDLQGSANGKDWKTLTPVRGGKGGHEEVKLSGEARHVRLQGVKRGTDWGWSLFSFDVYGKAPGGGDGMTLQIEPALAQLTERQTAKFTAYLVDKAGQRQPVQAEWQVRGRGHIAPDGTFTPQGGATFDQPKVVITASADGRRASAAAVVEEARQVKKINLSPQHPGGPLRLGVGMRIAVHASAADQFGAWISQPPAFTVEGPLKYDGQFVTTTGLGKGAYVAQLGSVRARQEVEVVPADQVNLAAGCAVSASSQEAGNGPGQVVDQNPQTRWSSVFTDPQWIQVDLGRSLPLRRVVLNWENAHARQYRLESSDDGVKWTTLHEEDDSRGGSEEIALPVKTQGRYLRVYGLTRSTGYGYSLFEIEAYGPVSVPARKP